MLLRRGECINRRGLLVTGAAFAAAAAGARIGQTALAATPGSVSTFSSAELGERTIKRRAVEAAIWGMPIVSFDAMRQAFFRDAKASFGDIMFWSRPGSWKLQCLTPNTSVRYVLSFINTRQAGPMVFEVPGTGDAALNGTILDAWQVPLSDVGIVGEDRGKGGKYLLLPPDHAEAVPSGYIVIPMKTYNALAGLRVIIKDEDEESVRKALAYLRLIRIYPLRKSAASPQSNFVDMADTVWDAVPRFDDSFYRSLAHILSEEPTQPRDGEMTHMLRTLDIEKGKEFKPDATTSAELRAAAEEAHAARARSGASRTSLYDEIVAELEAGHVPWVQPWGTAAAKAPLAIPKNASTGRCYSGINVLILWRSVIEHGFPVQGWLTFRQALGLGGNVRKGEHGTTVVYADRFIPDDEKKRAQETGEEEQAIPFLKRFTVLNLAQCEILCG